MKVERWHEGRVAIVTGGATGIGLEIARTLLRRGASVAVGARRMADAGHADAIQRELGDGAVVLPLDVCDPGSVEVFYTSSKQLLGIPDVLINAAGVSTHQIVEDHSEEDWLQVIDSNLNGPFRMTRACIGNMKARGWGRIVNIGSTAATTAVETHAAYCASKSGLLGLTRAVALEGAPYGVTCTSVSPTWVETPMLRQSAASMAAKVGRTQAEEIALLAKANPQNRLVQPSEIAEMVSFLCSDLAPALTMEDIQINAGAYW